MKKVLPGLGGFFGIVFVMVGLVVMNGLEGPQRNKKGGPATSFDLSQVQKKKKKKQKVVRQKKIRKKRKKVAPPSLSGSLSGSSFGLGQFEFLAEGAEGLLGNTTDVIMTEDTVDEVPNPSYRPPLKYPDYARKRGLGGHVLLNLLVDSNGAVQDVRLLSSEPVGVFDQVAMESVRDWSFEPAMYKGNPVKVWVKQKISFNLN
ncbi:MAG: energy transducer TonB [Halobacteriovoraceae bacterium]|nr:energy transducer TonB [Halobacteriovoraceae bacterium]